MCFNFFLGLYLKRKYVFFLQLFFLSEKSEITKKVCLHCNASFPSAVSLSNHLRAYARRKRAALLEGTSKIVAGESFPPPPPPVLPRVSVRAKELHLAKNKTEMKTFFMFSPFSPNTANHIRH